MLKNLFAFGKEKDFLTKEMEDFEKMIQAAEAMYRTAVGQLTSGELPGLKVRDELYETDKGINEWQRKIRTRLVSHLSFQPGQDVPTALILMSVVKDAERLGDYAKNVFEVSDLLTAPFKVEYYDKWFRELDDQLLSLFSKTKECFLESDEKLAREIVAMERVIVKGCDEGLQSLASSGIDTNVAVCAALIYRYFKRIGAHLGNIATSVIMPISDLDYYDEKRRLGGDTQ